MNHMLKRLAAPLITLAAIMATPTIATAASSSTPTQVARIPASALNETDVAARVTADGPATITMTSEAYRNPVQVEAKLVVVAAGTYEIRAKCVQTRLPHSWKVWYTEANAAPQLLASAWLKCS